MRNLTGVTPSSVVGVLRKMFDFKLFAILIFFFLKLLIWHNFFCIIFNHAGTIETSLNNYLCEFYRVLHQ